MGVSTTKKTKARMIRVETKERPAANVIHALRGKTNARGRMMPERQSTIPSGKTIGTALGNLPRYNHHIPRRVKTPPTMRPNSLSARNDFLVIRISVLKVEPLCDSRCSLCLCGGLFSVRIFHHGDTENTENHGEVSSHRVTVRASLKQLSLTTLRNELRKDINYVTLFVLGDFGETRQG
jgi:hypothetical protein